MSDPGFSIFEDVLSPAVCNALAAAVEDINVDRQRAGARNLMSNPAISALACDPRLVQLAVSTLGAPVTPFRATLFDKSKMSNWQVLWHQDRTLPLAAKVDSTEWGPWSTKSGVLYALAPAWALERVVALRIHIDPSTNDNGPLRVISGSHKSGVLSGADILQATKSVAPTKCLVRRGGVMAMRPLLLHSSTKARDNQPRRVLHIEYSTSLNFGNDVRLGVA